MPTLLIKNARYLGEPADLLAVDGAVRALSSSIEAPADAHIVDAAGNILFPSFIDVHTHLREPGYEWKETVATGLAAAAIIEASGIDADAIGAVHIHNRSTSVDIAAEQIDLVVKKMKKAKIRGKNVRVSREEKAEKEPAQKKRAENGKKKNRSSESLKKKKFRKTKKEKQ